MKYVRCRCGQLLTHPDRVLVDDVPGGCEVLTIAVGLTCHGNPCISAQPLQLPHTSRGGAVRLYQGGSDTCDECGASAPCIFIGPLIPGETHPSPICAECLRAALSLLVARTASNRHHKALKAPATRLEDEP